ncbi:MAG: transglutaminase domain-containing protein [Dehalococcoidia bacterium]
MQRDRVAFGAFLWRLVLQGEVITSVLVALVLLSVAWPLERGGWVDPMPPLGLVAIAALGTGILLGKSRLPRAPAHLLALVLGFGVTVWGVADLLPGPGWSQKVAGLGAALGEWGQAVGTGATMEGAIEFAALMLFLMWVLGYSSAWLTLHRGSAWRIVLPCGLVLLFVLSNLPESYHIYLGMYLLASLLLVVHLNLLRRQREWTDFSVSFPRMTGLTHLGHLSWIGVIVLLAAWNLPQAGAAPLSAALDWTGVPWGDVQNQFGRLFASLPSQKSAKVLEWGSDHTFEGPLLLGSQMLFTVDSKEERYWRARVYDVYTSRGWVNSPLVEEELKVGFSLEGEGKENWAREAYTIRVNSFADNLFTAGEPIQASIPGSFLRRQEPPWDLMMLRPQRELRLAQKYSILSLVSSATSAQLREAGTVYPEPVSAHYLRLPPGLPRRVRGLSRTLTQDLSSPYEKAIAIQRYLRAITYDTNIAAPPPGADGVDYLLFDRRAGYCDYYASAMAVMLRSVGIPSRFVVGYQPGDWDGRKKVHVILESHYHSWPEVYFPGYGWIGFEPTPSLEERVYAPAPSDAARDSLGDDEEEEDLGEDLEAVASSRSTLGSLLLWGGGPALLLASLLAVGVWYRRWWVLSRLYFPADVYAKMGRLASLSGIGPQPHLTPAEYAARLSSELPSQAAAISLIAVAYGKTQYSTEKSLGIREVKPIHRAWTGLKRALLARIIRRRRGIVR